MIGPGWASQIWAMPKSKDSHLIMDMLDNTSTQSRSSSETCINIWSIELNKVTNKHYTAKIICK